MPRLEGKTALITGAASGIGKATAELFAKEGAEVIATDVNGGAAVRLDVSADEDWRRAIEPLAGKLDILVANAGISHASPITETPLDQWRRVMAVNLDGVFLGLKYAIAAMRQSGRGGNIVIVSSASGIKASPGAAAYCASKAALRLLARCAALECIENGDNIRVNTVNPAGVLTPMWKSMPFFQDLVRQNGGDEEAAWRAIGALPDKSPLKRFSTPEEVARTILFLASDDTPTVTGAELAIDSGFTA